MYLSIKNDWEKIREIYFGYGNHELKKNPRDYKWNGIISYRNKRNLCKLLIYFLSLHVCRYFVHTFKIPINYI